MYYWIITHLEIVLVALLVLVTAVVVLQQRRTPQSAAAWLLAIIVVPWLAIPLFLGLGFRKRHQHFSPISFSEGKPELLLDDPHSPGVMLQAYGIPPASDGNRFELLTTPREAHLGLMELVETAEQSLDVLFYIVTDDPVGTAFVESLEAKARAGVEVRILLDRLGTLGRSRKDLAKLQEAGGVLHYFSPLLQPPASGHLNLRNHRKMVIADNARVFAGGMNIGKTYFSHSDGGDAWTDLAFRLDGPAVRAYCDVFRSDWAVTRGETFEGDFATPEPAGTARVQPVPSGPDIPADPLHDTIVNAIHTATRRVWIATPYFLPTEILSHALITAARRGIDVRILLPGRSNQRLADFARGAYLREMQDAGARVLFFQRGMFHAKAGILDDTAFTGSANMDIRSMLLNFEIALFVYDRESVAKMVTWYEMHQEGCSQGVSGASLPRRVLEGLFRLGAPVL